ncbi:MAG: hypothetical protein NUV63_13710 [Gallionella sp.]|nr:hypothetical protein [Gallionella sp.]
MKKAIFTMVSFLTFLLAGCASGPQLENYVGQDAACIEGDVANFFKYASGEAHVHIREIDSLPTSGRSCVAPGMHRYGVSAHNNYMNAYEYVDLKFESGKRYKMRANLQGITFIFRLLDITDGNETQLSEFRAKVSNQSSPQMIPIIIPTGK